jgi:protein-disulfide isomerase
MSKEIKILGAIIIIVIIAAIVGTNIYRSSSQSEISTSNNSNSKSSANNEALIRSDSYTLGSADAKVTIVEFLDPECEACAAFHPIMKKVLKDYEGKTRLVVRYMPLHPNSLTAATFLEAAGEQGKYWEAQDLLFSKQPEWGTKHGQPADAPKPDISALFKGYAKELKLDTDQIDQAFAQNKFAEKIARDKKDGESLYVQRTPTIFVNGKKLATLSEPALTYLIDQQLKN